MKNNATAREGDGAACLLPGDTSAYSTATARRKYLCASTGISFTRAALIAPLIFGEVAHV